MDIERFVFDLDTPAPQEHHVLLKTSTEHQIAFNDAWQSYMDSKQNDE